MTAKMFKNVLIISPAMICVIIHAGDVNASLPAESCFRYVEESPDFATKSGPAGCCAKTSDSEIENTLQE